MADEHTQRLHAEIVQGGMSIGRIVPSKLEMAMIKQTLGI